MPKAWPFEIIFDEHALESFDLIEAKYDSLLRKAIETQLRFEPHVETGNRKRLQQPTEVGATWELRCGPNNRFRIFYDIHVETHTVVVLLIAVKIRNQLWVGKERFEL